MVGGQFRNNVSGVARADFATVDFDDVLMSGVHSKFLIR
jgi:hypothetical protein